MTGIIVDYVKVAFDVYSHRAGDHRPWERLSNSEQAGWIEAVSFIEDVIGEEIPRLWYCAVCDAPLECPNCDADDDDKKEEAN